MSLTCCQYAHRASGPDSIQRRTRKTPTVFFNQQLRFAAKSSFSSTLSLIRCNRSWYFFFIFLKHSPRTAHLITQSLSNLLSCWLVVYSYKLSFNFICYFIKHFFSFWRIIEWDANLIIYFTVKLNEWPLKCAAIVLACSELALFKTVVCLPIILPDPSYVWPR